MKGWTTEVHLVNLNTGERQTIIPDGDDTEEVILALCQVHARFEYNGISYYGEKPVVDPIARKLIYYCEGYPRS